MRNFDLTPLFRTSIGFDNMARLIDSMAADSTPSYPPYNIEKLGDNQYQISMAVAGFAEEDLTIDVLNNELRIIGRKDVDKKEEQQRKFLHRGIGQRAFDRRFSLAEHIKIEGALLENGLLHIKLMRDIPEEAKPRNITINAALKSSMIEG